ncbi:MAG: sulfatase-like hydrolase/transferase [Planctomycetota bacterium]
MPNDRSRLRWTLFCLAFPLLAACSTIVEAEPAAQTPPNIVLIMIDDIGAEAIGAYGGTSYATPRIDQLAETGVRFNNCYASPACTPSRVQIMSGKYPYRTGWSGFINLKAEESNNDYVNPQVGSFALRLQELGYATAVGGKWQLARLDKRPDHLAQMGFNEHAMWTWIYENRYQSRYWEPKILKNGELFDAQADDYGPDVINDFLLEFMERKKDGPFFVYYPMLLVHAGFHPTSDFEGDPLAEMDRIKKQDRAAKKKDRKYKNTAKSEAGAATYFPHMVSTADNRIGRVIDKLQELGVYENTVVIVTGDNGTPYQVYSELEDERGKLTIKGGKQNLGETGCRVPLIARWPTRSPQGTVLDDLVDFSDFKPTLVELAGGTLKPGEVDGVSFAPQVIGQPAPQPRAWAHAAFKDRRFVRDRRFMLYGDGRFIDLADRYRPKPASPDDSPEAQGSFDLLKAALDAMPPDADRYRWEK